MITARAVFIKHCKTRGIVKSGGNDFNFDMARNRTLTTNKQRDITVSFIDRIN